MVVYEPAIVIYMYDVAYNNNKNKKSIFSKLIINQASDKLHDRFNKMAVY